MAYQSVPAYQAIYGGYAMFAAAEFSGGDLPNLYENKEGFVKKLAGQFIYGVQLGWQEIDSIIA